MTEVWPGSGAPAEGASYTKGMDAPGDALRMRLALALPLTASHEIDDLVRMMSLPPVSRRQPVRPPGTDPSRGVVRRLAGFPSTD
jgi:hypothetical protein